MIKARLYYDGECPFCNHYSKLKELQNCINLKLCDAREDKNYENLGLKLDDGVILILEDDTYYQGVEAIRFLENICNFKGFFFLLQKWIFKVPFLRDGIYSFLKLLRTIALTLKK